MPIPAAGRLFISNSELMMLVLNPIQPSLAEAEVRWLKRYGWLFPVLGFPLGLLIKGALWSGTLLNASFLPSNLAGWLSPLGLLIGTIISLVPVAWWLMLTLEIKIKSGGRGWLLAPVMACVCFILLEMAFRTYPVQAIFWQGVIARAGDQTQAREVGLYRLQAAADRKAKSPAGFVFPGSSQVVQGIDCAELSQLTGAPVYRRAVSRLFPIELICSQGLITFNHDNRLILLLSGFDVGARADLVPDAIRPQATWSGLRHVLRAAPASFQLRHWRNFVDLCFAASCDLWRSRDYVRFMWENPVAPNIIRNNAAAQSALNQQLQGYQRLGSNPEMVALCWQALDLFLGDMAQHFQNIIVFESRINPTSPPSASALDLENQTRRFFENQQHLQRIRFIPRAAQHLDLPPEYWADNTHVNAAGRQLLTEMIARFVDDTSP